MAGKGLIGELIDFVNEQIIIYGELLDLAVKKKDVIIKNDLAKLREITELENSLIGKSRRLEKARLALIKDIANVLNEKESNITLEYLVDIIREQPESKELEGVGKSLRSILTDIKKVNEQNKLLIQNSLDYIDFSINVIRSTVSDEPSFYSPYEDDDSSNRGFFDAKQ